MPRGKLQAVDLVEFNPRFDIDSQGPCGGPTGMANRPLVALTIQYILTVSPPIAYKERQAMFSQQPRTAPAPFYEKVKQAISERFSAASGVPTTAFLPRRNW